MRRLLLLLITVLLAFTSWTLWMTSERTNQRLQADQADTQGQARIGGDFTLTDQNGRIVHDADLRGRVMLIFFGFTHCPDICPVTVSNLSKAMDMLGARADQAAPIFITTDPERDTPAVMKDFLSNFNKRMISLTGTPEQVKDAAAGYKVYYSKHPMPAMAAMKNDYTVDHSAFIYVMGKDGKFIQVLPNNAGAAEIARVVQRILK